MGIFKIHYRKIKLMPRKSRQEPICDCGKPISQCTCSGHNHKGKTIKRLSKAEERYSHGRSGNKKIDSLSGLINAAPRWKNLDPVKDDSYSARDQWRKKQYSDAYDWANQASIMSFLNNQRRGGRAFEQDNSKTFSPSNILSEYSDINMIDYPEYNYGELPMGLVRGRTFFGMPGGRSGRGVGTSKRMSKSMDMKTRNPKMPSTKRDIRNTDKYFN